MSLNCPSAATGQISLGHPLNSGSRGESQAHGDGPDWGGEQDTAQAQECWLHWPQRDKNLLKEGRERHPVPHSCPLPVLLCPIVLCDLSAAMGCLPLVCKHPHQPSQPLQVTCWPWGCCLLPHLAMHSQTGVVFLSHIAQNSSCHHIISVCDLMSAQSATVPSPQTRAVGKTQAF